MILKNRFEKTIIIYLIIYNNIVYRLISVLNYIIFTYFYKYKQKINLYHEKIRYKSL